MAIESSANDSIQSNHNRPSGMVMGPDGKPCKVCTVFRNWQPQKGTASSVSTPTPSIASMISSPSPSPLSTTSSSHPSPNGNSGTTSSASEQPPKRDSQRQQQQQQQGGKEKDEPRNDKKAAAALLASLSSGVPLSASLSEQGYKLRRQGRERDQLATTTTNRESSETHSSHPSLSSSSAAAAATSAVAASQQDEQHQHQHQPPTDCPPDITQLGSATWTFLHTTAAYYPPHPTPSQRAHMLSLLHALPVLYPCTHCATHLGEEMKKPGKAPDVSSRQALERWLCERHNEVNRMLGKEVFDCALVGQRWRDGWEDGRCD